MIFEGSEKKLEIVVKKSVSGLRKRPKEFWVKLVEKCQAQILSQISSKDCDAYLLSESSLSVWDDRITMITCGKTVLVDSAQFFLESVELKNVESLIFERKNEYFPHQQKTDFYSDIERLAEMVPGCAYRLGSADEHHLFLFHLNQEFSPKKTDRTLETLMYDLQSPAKELLVTPGLTKEKIRSFINLSDVLPGFEIDDYVFEPYGYSLNAVRGSHYYTIHVTPQETSSYVSFETNFSDLKVYQATVEKLVEIFKPMSFDIVSFGDLKQVFPEHKNYVIKNRVQESLLCGYDVQFAHYYKPAETLNRAKRIL